MLACPSALPYDICQPQRLVDMDPRATLPIELVTTQPQAPATINFRNERRGGIPNLFICCSIKNEDKNVDVYCQVDPITDGVALKVCVCTYGSARQAQHGEVGGKKKDAGGGGPGV